MTSRWRYQPWGINAKAICERIESLITETRLAQLRASEGDDLIRSMNRKTTELHINNMYDKMEKLLNEVANRVIIAARQPKE